MKRKMEETDLNVCASRVMIGVVVMVKNPCIGSATGSLRQCNAPISSTFR